MARLTDDGRLLQHCYGRIPLEQWRPLHQWVYARDDGRCQYCGESIELFNAHIHHILPLKENGGLGTNHPTNLKTVCVACHKEIHPFMKTAMERFL